MQERTYTGSRAIHRQGSATAHVTPAGKDQVYVTASPVDGQAGPASTTQDAYGLLAEVLKAGSLHIVHERIFGSVSAGQDIVEARGQVLSSSGMTQIGPATYIQGRPCWGDGLAGVCIQAVRADDVRQVCDDSGTAAGYAWKRHGAEFLMLQNAHGLVTDGKDNSPEAQATRMFDKVEQILQSQDATYRDVVRTWIYLADILGWYDRFNAARNERYYQFGIMPDLAGKGSARPICLPASTGIEGDNPMAAACVMDVLAVTGPTEIRPDVEQMTNVRQEDAFMYGSAFSRGAYLKEQDVASILISGTAAIDEKGQSLHVDDVRGQIMRTFDNVETLIGEKGASLKDVCEANVFLKHSEDINVYHDIAAQRGLSDMPAVYINADVCRRELLFEMDGVALIPS